MCAVRYKIELLCQLPKPRFEAKVPFGDNWCFLVRRQNVAKYGAPLLAGCRVVAYTGWSGAMARVKKSRSPVTGAEEYICQCPRCLPLETLWFKAAVLIPTVKFSQGESGRGYHDCDRGSAGPCWLFSNWEVKPRTL